MLPICPHLVPDYFEKVKDIVKVYYPQIVEQVDYSIISDGLISRKVISQEHNEQIKAKKLNRDRMIEALEIIQNRLWGLENFIMMLMDQNINPWITEELFQAYSRYLIEHIKKQKSIRKCDCPLETQYLGILNDRWQDLLATLNSWLSKFKSTIGFLEPKLFSTTNALLHKMNVFNGDAEAESVIDTDGIEESRTETQIGPLQSINMEHLNHDKIIDSVNCTEWERSEGVTSSTVERSKNNEPVEIETKNSSEHTSGTGSLMNRNKKDIGLQYDAEDNDAYDDACWFGIEEEIAALEISRISSMSLDLDWDLDDDEIFEFHDNSEDYCITKIPQLCESNCLNISTQTGAFSKDEVQEKAVKVKSISSVSSLKPHIITTSSVIPISSKK